MNIALIKNKIRYGSFFIPFRFLFILLVIALLLAWRWLQKTNALPDTSYTAILSVFIQVTFWFIVSIFAIAFLTSFIPLVIFLFTKKNKAALITIKTAATQNTFNDRQLVNVNIKPIFKPLLGFIRLRLQYDEDDISEKFSLINNQKKQQLFSASVNGIFNWPLNEIREYKVTESIIYFEDMFQFFSFATTLPAQDNFFTQPKDVASSPLKVQPKKTEDTNVRIDQIRKVEGEFLNYKNFEGNDDVRRIVWKIYAKNKELVVRIPETNDPYASHVYFYASFYNSLTTGLYKDFNGIFLNYYKTNVWSAFKQLSTQNVLVKFIPDQEIKIKFADDPLQKIKYLVSTAEWQTQKDLQQYFKKDEASVLCISSLIDAEQIKNVLEIAGENLVVIFINISHSFNTMKVTDWLRWLFVRPNKDSLDKLRLTWNFSLAKRNIIENEKKIRQLLDKSGCEKIIL